MDLPRYRSDKEIVRLKKLYANLTKCGMMLQVLCNNSGTEQLHHDYKTDWGMK